MTDYRVRPIREGDIESIIAIDALCTGTGGPGRAGFWRGLLSIHAATEEDRGPESPQPPCLCEVAEHAGDGRVAGFIIGDVQSWQFGIPRHGSIVAIGVHPDHRRRGVATLLAGGLRKTFEKMGLPFALCLVSPGDPLADFFRSVGFNPSRSEILEMTIAGESPA